MTTLEKATARFQRAETEMKAATAELRRVISNACLAVDRAPLPEDILEKAHRIIDLVANFHGVLSEDILGPRKWARITGPRQEAMTLCIYLLQMTQCQIGAVFHRDHGTVCYARIGVEDRCEVDSTYAARFRNLRARCTAAVSTEEAA